MIIVRYGEIGLKGKLRKKFENLLVDNIRRVLRTEKLERKISKEWGRIYIHSSDEKIAKRVAGVFGVTSTSVAIETEPELDAMVKKAVDAAAILTPKKSFAVRARRAGEHDFTSMDIQRIVGAEIKKKTGAKVDLKNPDVCIYIEAREKKSFIYTSIIRGFGGLPVGSQERVLSIMNDEKSILSTWYALRRGCDVDVLLSEQMDVHDILLPWACYRKIGLHLSKGNMKDLLCKAFETDYPAVYCSATFEEAENLISTSLLKKRRMPVFTPLLSLKEEEIQKKIQIIKSYFNCKKRSM